MTELLNRSLAQIVNSNHRTASVFEKFHLDFCCKGKRSLGQACAESDLNPGEVIAALEFADQGAEDAGTAAFQTMPLSQLIDYIVSRHHSYVKTEMPAILGYLQKIAAKHGGRHPELIKILELFTSINQELTDHMEKEEMLLFPRIKEIEQQRIHGLAIGYTRAQLLSPISMMEQEHDLAGSLLAGIRELSSDFSIPADGCTTYRLSYAALNAFELDLHQHVHLENNILFPKALALFEQAAQGSMN